MLAKLVYVYARLHQRLAGAAVAIVIVIVFLSLTFDASPARAASCTPQLHTGSARGQIIKLGQTVELFANISRNGTGCARDVPAEVTWSVARYPALRFAALRPRRRGIGLKTRWRWTPREAGVYRVRATTPNRRLQGQRSFVVVVHGPPASRLRSYRVSLRVAVAKGLPARSRGFLRLVYLVPDSASRWRRTGATLQVPWRSRRGSTLRLPRGHYDAFLFSRPDTPRARVRFVVDSDNAVRHLRFTAAQLQVSLGWVPKGSALDVALQEADGEVHTERVEALGRAWFRNIAEGAVKLRFYRASPSGRHGKPSLYEHVARISRSGKVDLPLSGVKIFARTGGPVDAGPWKTQPGLKPAHPAHPVKQLAPGSVAALISAPGRPAQRDRLVALGYAAWRRDGKRWIKEHLSPLMHPLKPKKGTALDRESWAWIGGGYRWGGVVNLRTRLGVSQELVPFADRCETTAITSTRSGELVIVGRCRPPKPKRPYGVVAVRGPRVWSVPPLRLRPLLAVASAGDEIIGVGEQGQIAWRKKGKWRSWQTGHRATYRVATKVGARVFVGGAFGVGVLRLRRGGQLRIVPLPWKAGAAPTEPTVMLATPSGDLISLFGPRRVGVCPQIHRSRVARLKGTSWKIIADSTEVHCDRCNISGGRCTPRRGQVYSDLAQVGGQLWGLARLPVVIK